MYTPTPPADLPAVEAEVFTLLMWRDRIADVIQETLAAHLLACDQPLVDRIAVRTATDAVLTEDYLAELDTVIARAEAALDAIWLPDIPVVYGDDEDIDWEPVPQTVEARELFAAVLEVEKFRLSAHRLQVLRRTPHLAAELRQRR